VKNKSIIHEPGPEHEYNNSGFLIGGMIDLQSLFDLALHYKTSADELVRIAIDLGDGNYIFGYPVLFLYRHSIELALKSLYDKPYDRHNYEHLMDHLRKIAKERFNEEVPKWFNSWFVQLNKIDPNSEAFRYGEVIGGEYWVSFLELKEITDSMFTVFKTVKSQM